MEEKLIEQVRHHEILYNIQSTDYRNQSMRQEAWEEIGRALKITPEKTKVIWDKLRRCYMNARSRRRIKKSGDSTKKIVPWKFEEEMSFLLPFLENRKIHGNLLDDSAHSHESTEDLDMGNELTEVETVDIHLQENDQVRETQEVYAEVLENQEVAKIMEGIKRRKRETERKNNPAYEVVEIMKENAALRKLKHDERTVRSKPSYLETLDEMDMFFLSMSKMAKGLPKIEQAKIKLTLSSAVLQAEINAQQNIDRRDLLRSDHYSSSPSYTSSYMQQNVNRREQLRSGHHSSASSYSSSYVQPILSPEEPPNFQNESTLQYSSVNSIEETRPTLMELSNISHTLCNN